MDMEIAKKLVEFIVLHMQRESALLYPDPQVVMYEPYGLLHLIRNAAKLSPETVDQWMVEAQKSQKKIQDIL